MFTGTSSAISAANFTAPPIFWEHQRGLRFKTRCCAIKYLPMKSTKLCPFVYLIGIKCIQTDKEKPSSSSIKYRRTDRRPVKLTDHIFNQQIGWTAGHQNEITTVTLNAELYIETYAHEKRGRGNK